MKKREEYVSPAAQNAANRHEEQTGHPTMTLYDDDNCAMGMCCANQKCDWMRYNVQPRKTIGDYEKERAAATPPPPAPTQGASAPADFELLYRETSRIAHQYRREVVALRKEVETLHESAAAATTRAEAAEGRAAELAKLLPPEGDGGIWALQTLAAYFYENGNRAAYSNIRAAAHNAGWCIDSGGADDIVPTTGACPLCEYTSAAQPEPAAPLSPSTGSGDAEPTIGLRADRVGFQSPEYAARIDQVRANVESLEEKNPNRKTRPANHG